MKGEIVQFAFVLIVLVASAAAEEVAPAFAGVGLPLLLAFVLALSPRIGVVPGVMTAVAAGAFEDALAFLPPMTSVCFFVIAALLSRREGVPRPCLVAAFPAFELWAGMCASGPVGDLFARAFVAVPLGAVALVVQRLTVDWGRGKAGIDE